MAKSTNNNVKCSKNVLYDAVGNTIKMSTQDNMTCSKNVAYATIKEVNENELRACPTGSNAVYDETSPGKS